MSKVERSLRAVIEKWLGAEQESEIETVRSGHLANGRTRYVSIVANRRSGTLTLFFFRHGDGSWNVFPPSAPHATMGGRWLRSPVHHLSL
ncbi:hypothetical protein ACQKRQ_27015 [Paraburkholderia sp. NPDC080076]|uniref:hypothetical protein n=1 Tax=Paraburkholderia sp. NPDC080076 TaxID=3390605 RepID=UPI003D090FCF